MIRREREGPGRSRRGPSPVETRAQPLEWRWRRFLEEAGFTESGLAFTGIALRADSVCIRFLDDPSSRWLPPALRVHEVEERRALLFQRAPVPPPGLGVFEEWFELVCSDLAGGPRDFPVPLLLHLMARVGP